MSAETPETPIEGENQETEKRRRGRPRRETPSEPPGPRRPRGRPRKISVTPEVNLISEPLSNIKEEWESRDTSPDLSSEGFVKEIIIEREESEMIKSEKREMKGQDEVKGVELKETETVESKKTVAPRLIDEISALNLFCDKKLCMLDPARQGEYDWSNVMSSKEDLRESFKSFIFEENLSILNIADLIQYFPSRLLLVLRLRGVQAKSVRPSFNRAEELSLGKANERTKRPEAIRGVMLKPSNFGLSNSVNLISIPPVPP